MKAVILQPTYLPWMGYFGMIDLADIFVFLDDVQFEAQSWQQRNRIKTSQGCFWLTVPIVRHFGQNIKETKINNGTDWNKKHWESIKQSYSKAQFFDKYAPLFLEIYEKKWEYIADLNTALIKNISEILGLKTRFIYSSEFHIKGVKTERLIKILKEIDATKYITGPGTRDYIESDRFKENNIELYWYEYQHPVYPQIRGDFIAYLSVLDLLFNTGDEAISYIREGSKNALTLDKKEI